MAYNKLNITLIVTNKCNLNCSYCYESRKDAEEMSFETGQRIIRDSILNGAFDAIQIDFHGGEPFLNFKLIKELCEWTWYEFPDRKVQFFTTTNGTILTEEMETWISHHREKFCVAVSMDGTPEMNRWNRGTVIPERHLNFYHQMWPLQPIKMTVSKETISGLAEGIIYAHTLGFNVNANLAYGINWEDAYVDIYREELKKLVKYYGKNENVLPCSILNHSLIKVLSEKENIRHCGAGKRMKAYDTRGNCYPCQMFAPNTLDPPDWEKVENWNFESNDSLYQDDSCGTCLIYNICPTCYGNNYLERGHIGKRDKRLCQFIIQEKIAESEYWVNKLQHKEFDQITEREYLELKAAMKIIETYGKL